MRAMPDAPPPPEPFTAQAAPAVLEDLRARLRATRWPDAPDGTGWSLGTDLAYLRELVAYWADGFDWPAQEAMLARLPRFRVRLGGRRRRPVGRAHGHPRLQAVRRGGRRHRSGVSHYLGLDYPGRVVAVHRTDAGL